MVLVDILNAKCFANANCVREMLYENDVCSHLGIYFSQVISEKENAKKQIAVSGFKVQATAALLDFPGQRCLGFSTDNFNIQ